MFKQTFLSVVGISILALVLGLYFSSGFNHNKQDLGYPWQVKHQPDGSITIFKINLGHTTLAQAESLFAEQAELSLFKPKDKEAVIEAYFDKILIAGFSSKLIISFSIDQSRIMGMYDRGARISTLGSGTRRVTLSSDDQVLIRNEAIASITYLQSANLTGAIIEKRFGKADQVIVEKKNETEHWLYPKLGVDVALHKDAKEVIMYVNPADFSKILTPLQNNI